MTEAYRISNIFTDNERKIVEKAVKKSKLPEGVNIIQPHELDIFAGPFAVIDCTIDASEVDKKTIERGVKAMLAGSEAFAVMTHDVDELVRRLNLGLQDNE